MFRRVDALVFFAAFLAIAGLVCFFPSNNFLPAWAYLCGPVLWFLGTVIAVVWMVWRFFPTSAAGSSRPCPQRLSRLLRTVATSDALASDCFIKYLVRLCLSNSGSDKETA